MSPNEEAPPAYTTWRGEARHLAALAAPVAIWTLGLMLMGFVDVVFVSKLNQSAQLAAVSLGHIFSFSVLVFSQGVLRGLDPFLSQAFGSNQRGKIGEHLCRGVLYAAVLAIPSVALHLAAGPLLELFAQPAEVIPFAARYCSALTWGLVPANLFMALSQFFQSLGRAKLPMVAILIANVVNVALDGALVLGVPALGVPALGVTGCALATSAVRWLMLALLVALGWRSLKAYWPESLRALGDLKAHRRVLRLGLPIGAQACLEGWAFSALGLMMGWLGEQELAAHGVAINLVALTYMVPSGIGAAASARVGHLIGARSRRWPRSAWLSVAIGAAWMAMTALLLYAERERLARAFTEEPEVIAIVASLMPIAAAFQLFDGVQAAAFGALRGAGDTRLPALLNIIGYWLIGLPLGYLLTSRLGYGAEALWGSVALALALIALLVTWRLAHLSRGGVSAIEPHVASDAL